MNTNGYNISAKKMAMHVFKCILLCVCALTCTVNIIVVGSDSRHGGVWDNGSGEGDEDQRSEDIFGDNNEDMSEDGGDSVRDVVDDFLSIVEQYERNKDNCTPGVTFNLGEGVITQYGQFRFRQQAEVAVNRANFLTRVWKGAPKELLTSEYFFYTQVRSMVEGDDDLFAAGNCYDSMQFKNYTLFCPYGYRLPNDSTIIMVKDLSVEYKYLGNDSEFFHIPKMNAERKLKGKYNETIGTLY